MHVLEKTDTSRRLQATAQMMMTQTHVSYHGQSLRSFGEKTLNRSTGEEEDLTRSRMSMGGVCVCRGGRAAALCGEVIATMCWECVRFEVDIMAGDGNKAAYYCTPKVPGVPTYECSLLQFWIDRMINTATQARIKQFGPSPKVRAKHFITCSYNDLVHLNHHLRGVKTEDCTEELAKKN